MSGETLTPKFRAKKKYKVMSQCPKCRKLATLDVVDTRRDKAMEVIERTRLCEHEDCHLVFDTIELRSTRCPHCNCKDSLEVKNAARVHGGIARTLKCSMCGNNIETKEVFPILEENRKRPASAVKFTW